MQKDGQRLLAVRGRAVRSGGEHGDDIDIVAGAALENEPRQRRRDESSSGQDEGATGSRAADLSEIAEVGVVLPSVQETESSPGGGDRDALRLGDAGGEATDERVEQCDDEASSRRSLRPIRLFGAADFQDGRHGASERAFARVAGPIRCVAFGHVKVGIFQCVSDRFHPIHGVQTGGEEQLVTVRVAGDGERQMMRFDKQRPIGPGGQPGLLQEGGPPPLLLGRHLATLASGADGA